MKRSPLKAATKAELLALLDWIISRRLDRDSFRGDLERQLSNLRFEVIHAEVGRLLAECERLAESRKTMSLKERGKSFAASEVIRNRITALNHKLNDLLDLE